MTGDPHRWLNLVHVDDGVDAILTAEVRGLHGAIYNIVDDEPVTRLAYYTRLAQLIGAPAPRFDDRPDSRSAHRRISNAKAKDQLGWRPRYPSYREGLPAALQETATE